MITIERAGPLTTVQDGGRRGWADLGVGSSGVADRESYDLANRLVGNPAGTPVLETTMGGLRLRFDRDTVVCVTGPPAPLTLDGRAEHVATALRVQAGSRLTVGVPRWGMRNYVAVRGGLEASQVLGSVSTDLLSGLGPGVVTDGETFEIGDNVDDHPCTDQDPRAWGAEPQLTARFTFGPRDDWFTEAGRQQLQDAEWVVGAASNRIGVRLEGPEVERAVDGELVSEGVVLGAIQMSPAGPIIFLPDHPVTGGYPVIGVVVPEDMPAVAQLRAGQTLRLVAVD